MSLLKTIKAFLSIGRSDDTDRPIEEFQNKIEYRFQDPELLTTALTHRSYAKSGTGEWLPSNERLEFLGDSVLGLIVSDFLFRRFPDQPEGDLTKTKSLLVNEASLHRTADEIDLGEYIFLSPDESRAGGRQRASILSDALEAIIGAMYLDGGLAVARAFVRRYLLSRMDDIIADKNFRNYKGDLLELLQSLSAGMPHYEIIEETGPDHDKTFTVGVFSGNEQIGAGLGYSKKDAEQKAAREALRHLKQKFKR